jgi:hypothetical protein
VVGCRDGTHASRIENYYYYGMLHCCNYAQERGRANLQRGRVRNNNYNNEAFRNNSYLHVVGCRDGTHAPRAQIENYYYYGMLHYYHQAPARVITIIITITTTGVVLAERNSYLHVVGCRDGTHAPRAQIDIVNLG